MNVKDYTAPELPDSFVGIVNAICFRQSELIEKYRIIEQLPKPPISLHTSNGQRIIKDFFWRSTEELCEGWEAWTTLHEGDVETRKHHVCEELADALHFLIEGMLYAGMSAQSLSDETIVEPGLLEPENIEQAFWRAVYHMGLASNFLKNRPWKQSQVPTDLARFREAMLTAWQAHLEVWACFGTEQVMFNYYFKKASVNSFRQRSKY